DVTAWCLLAFVVGFARPDSGGALAVILATAAFVGAMLVVVRPLAARWSELPASGPGRVAAVTGVIAAAMAAAAVSHAIGVHAVFGGFLFGAVIPADSP